MIGRERHELDQSVSAQSPSSLRSAVAAAVWNDFVSGETLLPSLLIMSAKVRLFCLA